MYWFGGNDIWWIQIWGLMWETVLISRFNLIHLVPSSPGSAIRMKPRQLVTHQLGPRVQLHRHVEHVSGVISLMDPYLID